MSKIANLLDTPLCPACAAPWVAVSELDGLDECSECGFEANEPLPLRRLLADDLPDDANDDWRDLATFARMVAHATLDNSAEVGRLLGREGRPADPKTVAHLVKVCHEAAKAKGWHDGVDPIDPYVQLGWMALLHSEVSEGVEDIRKRRLTETVRDDGKPEGLPSEFADVAIRLFDTCGALGIDLEGAILRKLAYNETRPHRHGGKAA